MNQLLKEGKASIKVPVAKTVSKELPVFYNPAMEFNRSISVLLLNSISSEQLQLSDPLAASGVRSIRFILELNKNKIKNISINDYSKEAVNLIKNNLKLNKIKANNKIIVKNEDANLFLLKSTGFDYIDLDPFGSPNPFLDSAAKRLARGGILAVTATDTSALSGTFPKACERKYWARPLYSELMHEIGLRILIRKAQLIGAQYEKALVPIFSYSQEHYMRIFLKCIKGKKEADEIIRQHSLFEGAGPIWTGQLFDEKLVQEMVKNNKDKKLNKFLQLIEEESKINSVGFFDIHKLCKANSFKIMPRKEELISKIKEKGFRASGTHFSETSIKTDMKKEEFVKLIKKSN